MDELLRFICVSWVFRKADVFSTMTHRAMLYSWGKASTKEATDLPVPAKVIGRLPSHSIIIPAHDTPRQDRGFTHKSHRRVRRGGAILLNAVPESCSSLRR